MSSLDDFAKLVENARQGEKDALDRLAEAVRVRLQEYVFRLTLEHDLTQDIVQESILEMFRVFEKLKRGERFIEIVCEELPKSRVEVLARA